MLLHVAKFPQDGYQNKTKQTATTTTKPEDKSIDEDEEKLEPYTLLVGLQNGYSCYLRVCRFLKILKVDLLYDLVIPFLDIYPKELKS